MFVRVRDAVGARRLPRKPQESASKPATCSAVVYDLITTRHRIFTPTAEFADYLEVDEDMKTEYPHLLDKLNAREETLAESQ